MNQAKTTNCWKDDIHGNVVMAVRVDDEWREFYLPRDVADQLNSQLQLALK